MLKSKPAKFTLFPKGRFLHRLITAPSSWLGRPPFVPERTLPTLGGTQRLAYLVALYPPPSRDIGSAHMDGFRPQLVHYSPYEKVFVPGHTVLPPISLRECLLA